MAKVATLDIRTVGDLAYPQIVFLTDKDGPVNLSTSTVVFEMRHAADGSIKTSGAMTVLGPGLASYQWQAADVNEAGIFHVRVIVTFPGAHTFHFPPSGYGELTFIPGTP